MSHLSSFRLGWQSQNVAQFLLYKFAFLSQPVHIADDIGTDYFCTLFETRARGGTYDLIPHNSFAIQIKSESKGSQIDLTKHVPYLAELEVPYFIGTVNRAELKLRVYSGELLPAFFAYKGIPQRLEAELCEATKLTPNYDGWHREIETARYGLLFPEVVEITASTGDQELQEKVRLLQARCSMMLKNIASIRSKEFILQGMGQDQVLLFAGPDSYAHFEINFVMRLIEAFYNLNWAFQSIPNEKEKTANRFSMYEQIYQQMAKEHGEENLPSILKGTYDAAKRSSERMK